MSIRKVPYVFIANVPIQLYLLGISQKDLYMLIMCSVPSHIF